MLAVVTAVRWKGKLLKQGSFWWDFFEKSLDPDGSSAACRKSRLFLFCKIAELMERS